MIPPVDSLWKAVDVANATGGRVGSDWHATGVSIDSRTIRSVIYLLPYADLILTVTIM